MPLYEYACQACGAQSEISHRMSDPPATVCPKCQQPALIKQMSAAGFRLKGAGWYETDFKSGNKRNLADGGGDKAGGDKPSGDKSGGDGGAAAKPAAAPSGGDKGGSSGGTSAGSASGGAKTAA